MRKPFEAYPSLALSHNNNKAGLNYFYSSSDDSLPQDKNWCMALQQSRWVYQRHRFYPVLLYTFPPSLFAASVADIDVQFVLLTVNRKYSSKKSWNTNDAMKYSRHGGIDATNPTEYLNMWVVNKMTSGGGTILGYAQFPGGNPATDGVVVGHNFFGRVGTLSPPFHKGRTATHEVGHWMNLRHIWGDATCGTDYVSDTPQHNTYNFGCPSYPHQSTCAGTPVEMTMNYMDYTDDACMYMFTGGQKQRAVSTFVAGGPRATFAD